MKKILAAAGIIALFTAPAGLFAQDTKVEKEEKIVKEYRTEKDGKDFKTKGDKKQTEEIIIRKNGDKEIKLNVEINGDDIKVNGKPLSEFVDKDVTINKKKIIISDGDNRMSWSLDGDNMEAFGKNFGDDFARKFKFDSDLARPGAFLGVTTEEDNGAKVTDVVKGSAAEKAGLKKDDIITKVNDDEITGPESLSDIISFKKPNDEVKITYKRNGKTATTKASLGKRKEARTYSFSSPRGQFKTFTLPAQPPMNGLNSEGNFNFEGPAYFEAMDMFPRQKKIGLKLQDTEEGNGVKVINVEDSSAAATAGLKKDDIIITINDKKIENTDDAREELVPEEGKKSYKIKALRNGSEMTFEVKIPRKLKTANF